MICCALSTANEIKKKRSNRDQTIRPLLEKNKNLTCKLKWKGWVWCCVLPLFFCQRPVPRYAIRFSRMMKYITSLSFQETFWKILFFSFVSFEAIFNVEKEFPNICHSSLKIYLYQLDTTVFIYFNIFINEMMILKKIIKEEVTWWKKYFLTCRDFQVREARGVYRNL